MWTGDRGVAPAVDALGAHGGRGGKGGVEVLAPEGLVMAAVVATFVGDHAEQSVRLAVEEAAEGEHLGE